MNIMKYILLIVIGIVDIVLIVNEILSLSAIQQGLDSEIRMPFK